jgi:hypothetical protein
MHRAADERDSLGIRLSALRWRWVLGTSIALLCLTMQPACTSTAPATSGRAASVASVSSSPSPPPPPSPSPSPSPAASPSASPAVVQPSMVAVAFSGLHGGTYPVHLHSRCSGSQSFHLTVLETLQITSAGTGSIYVPSSYFGRGLCLIVYTSRSLSAVLTTRQI